MPTKLGKLIHLNKYKDSIIKEKNQMYRALKYSGSGAEKSGQMQEGIWNAKYV